MRSHSNKGSDLKKKKTLNEKRNKIIKQNNIIWRTTYFLGERRKEEKVKQKTKENEKSTKRTEPANAQQPLYIIVIIIIVPLNMRHIIDESIMKKNRVDCRC